jgi:carbamoyltransferase
MRILGISAFYHDSAAALIEDGRIVAAAQEERFTRVKHDASFPSNAVQYCLAAGGAPDAVVYYEKPIQKFERILANAFAVAPAGFGAFAAAIPAWLKQKLWIPALIEEQFARLGVEVRDRIFFSSHHESHAASAFYPSPFARAAILTVDGVGEWTTTALGVGEGSKLRLLQQLRFPHSIGLLYSAFTYYCGFRVNSGEYKLMGLAPYGVPEYAEKIREHLIDLRPDGSFRLDLRFFGYLEGQAMTNERFHVLFGGRPRRPEEEITPRHCNLARSIQVVTEEVVLRMARRLHAETGEKNLSLAGGVALNCVANGRLLREGPFERIWVQPAAGDAGGALGAALAYYHLGLHASREADGRTDAMQGAYLGPEYSDTVVEEALAARGLRAERLEAADVPLRVARRVADGAVVGFFQGRAEFGPRALGNRSILADARSAEMQRVLNLKIKFRESFRPFAPVVLAEKAAQYFDLQAESPYMLLTAPVLESRRTAAQSRTPGLLEQLNEVRSDVPAVTHVDYSARVQTVTATTNAVLAAVLKAFEERTGCAVLINTSFNVRGEPPVCHPREAIECFLRTEMDCLSIGSLFLEKAQVDRSLVESARAASSFAPD